MKTKNRTIEVKMITKRTYSKPKLTNFGDVRDITLQASGEGGIGNPFVLPRNPRAPLTPRN